MLPPPATKLCVFEEDDALSDPEWGIPDISFAKDKNAQRLTVSH